MLWYKALAREPNAVRPKCDSPNPDVRGYCDFRERKPRESAGISFVEYIWVFTYSSYAKDLFLVATLLLSFGGLLRERTTGTAGFTLALPVLRSQLLAIRAAVGLLQMTALALVPALVVPGLSHFVHESYPFLQAWGFSILWVGCGTIVFAIGFLLSVIFRGEYMGVLAGMAVLVGYFAVTNRASLQRFPFVSLDRVMGGDDMPYFSDTTHQLIGPPPWMPLLVIMLLAIGLLGFSSRVVEQQDFSEGS